MKSRLAVLVLVLHASDAERTPGEVARFGFPYQSCKAGEFEDDQSSSRKLELGTGGGCAEGPFGNHLGVVLNASLAAPGAYAPLESTESQTDFTAEFTDGFTLELWVKPQKLPQGEDAREEAERDKEQALTKASERAAYLQAAALEAANELHLCRAGGGNGGVWRSPWRGSRRALADLS